MNHNFESIYEKKLQTVNIHYSNDLKFPLIDFLYLKKKDFKLS